MEKPKGTKILLSVLLAGISPLIYGYTLAISSVLYNRIQHLDPADYEQSFRTASTLMFLGAFLGNAASMLKQTSHVPMLVISDTIFILSFLAAFFLNTHLLLVSRMLTGIAAGIVFNVVPCYLRMLASLNCEINITSSFFSVGLVLGCLMGECVCYCDFGWRTPITLALVLIPLHGVSLLGCISFGPPKTTSLSLTELLKRRAAWRSLAVLACAHIAHHSAGITHIMIYAPSVFGNSSGGSIMMFFYLFALATIACSSFVMEQFGRKSLLLFSSAVVSVCWTAFYFSFFPEFFAILYVVGYNSGLSSIPFILIGEIFPPEFTPHAALLGTSCNWIAAAMVMQLNTESSGARNPTFLFYISSMLIFMGIILLFFKDTRGRSPSFQ